MRLDLGCDDAFIGDEDANGGNLIAHNEGAGVRAIGGTTTIRGNAIFLNDGLAIDAGPVDRTDNDLSDGSLPTNFPEVTGFERQDGELRIQACVPVGAVIELYEALTPPDRSPARCGCSRARQKAANKTPTIPRRVVSITKPLSSSRS